MNFLKSKIRSFGNFFTTFLLSSLLFCGTAFSQSPEYRYEIGLQHRADFFSEIYDPQHITSFHLGTNRSHGTYLFRVNLGNRFEQTGNQYEIETYPVFRDGYYAHLQYAFSDAPIFSRHRSGAELYFPFLRRTEGSVGIRYLSFDSGTESWIGTFSINHYLGSYLFTLRPYFIFSDSGRGQTITGMVRYFLNDRNDSFTIRTGIGQSPDRALFQLGSVEMDEELLLLKSFQIGAELRHHLTSSILGVASVDFNRQELLFDPGNYVNNWGLRVGIIYSF